MGRPHRRFSVFNLSFCSINRGLGRPNLSGRRAELRACCLDSSLGRFDLRPGNNVTLHRVVQILLRDCLLLSERRILVHVELSLDLIRLRLRELRL